jgi:hypothetical protein
LHMLGKHSTTEPNAQLYILFLKTLHVSCHLCAVFK